MTAEINSEQEKEHVLNSIEGLLLTYSEWLDVSGLLKPPGRNDRRTHSDLVSEYMAGRG